MRQEYMFGNDDFKLPFVSKQPSSTTNLGRAKSVKGEGNSSNIFFTPGVPNKKNPILTKNVTGDALMGSDLTKGGNSYNTMDGSLQRVKSKPMIAVRNQNMHRVGSNSQSTKNLQRSLCNDNNFENT